MGNRAVITFSPTPHAPCIYLHWNGGRASVEGLLRAARDTGHSLDSDDVSFEVQAMALDNIARLWADKFFQCEVGQTVYREVYGKADTDNHDNGVYIIDDDLNIVGRRFMRHQEEVDPEKTRSIYEKTAGIARQAA